MSIARRSASGLMALAFLIMTGVWSSPTPGDEAETIVLVATPQLHDPLYARTILIAKPLQSGHHMGFILNKPTQISLADALPGHPPSTGIRDPLYLGGPSDIDVLFALVAGHDSPGDGSMQLAPDLYLAVTEQTVDRVIKTAPDHARFFAGFVVWQPGELDEELKRGAWYLFDLDLELVFPKKTEGLWQLLVRRAEIRSKGI